MSATQIPLLASASMTSLPPSSVPRTLREHCDFALFISFAPAFPNIPAKGNIGPTAGNLPWRKCSSIVSLELSLLPPTSTLAAWDISHEAGQAWRAGYQDGCGCGPGRLHLTRALASFDFDFSTGFRPMSLFWRGQI
ncbi:hypothetical protein B0H13DRAFT_1919609 [Mycena leptocephala]|nr:hypothetical protein B0H13DRAFT_1919609 [Mycena leptocephala]